LQIRAQKQGENYEWSTPISYKFKIQPAWYQTWWAILSGLGLSFFLVWGIIRLYTLRLKKDKIKLEIIVNERTAVIEKQKEELTQQATEMIQTNTEMNIKKIELEKAYLNIEETNKNITDSINYASRIQAALLPSLEQIQKAIPDSFIFYQPREIVSGDYYWFVIKKQKIFIAAVDCTGHGVPGAFMSMIGHSFLNQIVNTNNIFQPELILKELHIRVKNALKQDETQVRDGMDIALCVIDVRRNILEFAGAKRPLIYIQDNQLFQIKGDPNAIGGRLKGDENIFTKKTIDISVPTCIYLMSDGFQDQFGGEANKKFTQKKLMDILKEIYPETMSKQYELLHNTFYEWKGTRRQIDDILLIGLQIGPNSIHINLKDEFNWSDKTILIAEDMNLNYLVIKNILSSTLANLVWVRNGQEAIDIIKGNTHIDLVLMDYDMPVKSGIEAINSIREFNQTLPIIVQTAYTHTGVREQSFKAGADDYITKPINAKELLAIIQKYFN
jgi:CheY-like chemotaxis protein